jgi:hypothetical protein
MKSTKDNTAIYSSRGPQHLFLEIFNLEGCLVKKRRIRELSDICENHKLECGCYFYRVCEGEEMRESGRFLFTGGLDATLVIE